MVTSRTADGLDTTSVRPHATDESPSTISRWISGVNAGEFVYRAPALGSDARRGQCILWLSSNDAWKRRVTEHLSIPRIDTLDTTLTFDVDLAQIQRRGLPVDDRGTYWLPLLSSGRAVPSVLEVTDESGDRVPRLTTAEVRWALAAGIARLLVRSQPDNRVQTIRRDVELLLAAAVRRQLAAGLASAYPAGGEGAGDPHGTEKEASEGATDVGLEIASLGAEHERRRTNARLSSARAAVERATWDESQEILELVAQISGRRFLVVECDGEDLRESYRCTLPSRGLKSCRSSVLTPLDDGPPPSDEEVLLSWSEELPEDPEPVTDPEALATPRTRRYRPVPVSADAPAILWPFRRFIATRDGRKRRAAQTWLLREGSLWGRAGLLIDLLADASATNYHLVLTLPAGTQAPKQGFASEPELHIDLDLTELATTVVNEVRACLAEAEAAQKTDDADHVAVRLAELTLERRVLDLGSAVLELTSFLSDPATPVSEVVVPERWAQLRRPLDVLGQRIQSFAELARSENLQVRLEWLDAINLDELIPALEAVDQSANALPQVGADAEGAETVIDCRIRRIYRTRSEGHPDQIHIAVPSTDRVPRTVQSQVARLSTGVFLAEPRLHTAVNTTNLLNAIVIGGTGLGLMATLALSRLRGSAPQIEADAVVAILFLFTTVQAARLERPGRTELPGWLSRAPYIIGFLSPLPALVFALYIGVGGTTWWSGWPGVLAVLAATVLAGGAQIGCLALGLNAGREAELWELGPPSTSSDGTQTSAAAPGEVSASAMDLAPTWIRQLAERFRRALSQRRGATVQSSGPDHARPASLPSARLLGELSSWLIPESYRAIPILGTAREGVSRSPDIALLQTMSMRRLLNEALIQIDSTRAWRVVSILMNDGRGTLRDELASLNPATDEGDAEPAEIAAALGVSFAGYAMVQLAVGREWDPSEKGAHASEASSPRTPFHILSPHPIDVEHSPIRTVGSIIEIQVCVPPSSLEAHLGRITGACSAAGLRVMLVHAPSTPPPGAQPRTDDGDAWIWLRVRVGVPPHATIDLAGLLRSSLAALPDERPQIRASSVAEFARPSARAMTSDAADDQLAVVSDRTANTGDGDVIFVFIHAALRRGLLHDILTALRTSVTSNWQEEEIQLVGISSYAMVGRAFVMVYLDGGGSADGCEALSADIARALTQGPQGDRLAEVHAFPAKGWPAPTPPMAAQDPSAREPMGELDEQGEALPPEARARSGPGMRLTWQAPNIPGVLFEIIEAVASSDLKLNLSYVLSRVSEVDLSLGRLVLRLEDGTHLGSGTTEGQPTDVRAAAAALADDLTRRLERQVAVERQRRRQGTPLAEREVFVTADVFEASPPRSGGTTPAEP